ncbi:Trihelix transcription factor ASR3 [Quillaja saponaria]|uniref:Trihelix transcription factor ASR3 n=1 Tax=Quillaja saponaria TaxID=32244 RepID=A0AAD7PKN0_QUISA|nr:Trihelix transcription factor ASR3 [Quillaja saponaria]
MGAKVEELFVLVIGKRKVKIFGLPENFDEELFKAIDDLVNAREERCDIDHDSDPEVEAEMLDVIAELGSKGKRRRFGSHRCRTEKLKQSLLQESLEGLSEGLC